MILPAGAITWGLRALGAGAVLAALWLAVVTPRLQLKDERAAHIATKAEHAEVLRDLADKTAEVARKVREREAQVAAALAESDERHKKERANALAAKDRTIADLRAGTVQLREWWKDRTVSCAADAADPADSYRDAERAGLREASAGRIVGAGAEADAWIRWLQRELIAIRAATGDEGSP